MPDAFGGIAPNKLRVPAASEPASVERKNLLRDHFSMIAPHT
jgi:hypothetical protein